MLIWCSRNISYCHRIIFFFFFRIILWKTTYTIKN